MAIKGVEGPIDDSDSRVDDLVSTSLNGRFLLFSGTFVINHGVGDVG